MKHILKKWRNFIDNPPTLTLVKLTAIFMILVAILATMVNADSYLNLRNLGAVTTSSNSAPASNSNCITQAQKDSLTRDVIAKAIARDNYELELNSLNASITISSSTQSQINTLNTQLTAKNTEVSTYTSQYTYYWNLLNGLRKPKPGSSSLQLGTYKRYYDSYNSSYTYYANLYYKAKAEYDSIKAQIDALTPKVSATTTARISTLTSSINSIQTQINSLNTQLSVKTCSTTSGGGSGSSGNTGYVTDTGSHALCDNDSDCSSGELCKSSMCVTSGSDVCSNDSDCKNGDVCNAARCEANPSGGNVFTNLNCCICTYNDNQGNPSNNAICSDQVTCQNQFNNNNCQIQRTYARSFWNSSNVTQLIYDTCGDLDDNNFLFFEEGHSCGVDGSITRQCVPMTRTLIQNWSNIGSIKYTFDNCKTVENQAAAYTAMQAIQQQMINEDYNGKVEVYAYQNNTYSWGSEPIEFCDMYSGVRYEICAGGIDITPQNCPQVGVSCLLSDHDDPDFQCTDSKTNKVKTMTCGGSPITEIKNSTTGEVQRWGKYQDK